MSRAGARVAWTDALVYIQQIMWKSLPHKCSIVADAESCGRANSDSANIENIEILRIYSNIYIYNVYCELLRSVW